VSDSEATSRAFYARLGADGLAGRTRPEWDAQIVAALVELLPATARVLDAGCGYGRVALPLARAGYDVEGLDHSEPLLDAARRAADAARLPARFTRGSLTRLPYESGSFDAAICLWSSFHELLEPDAQTHAIRELSRVLRPGGFGLIEGAPYDEPSENEIATGARRGPENRVVWGHVEGLLNPHFAHDETSLCRLCEAAGVERFQVFERDWGGRQRLFLRIGERGPAA
jgi:SAM-dependent methyltransferase